MVEAIGAEFITAQADNNPDDGDGCELIVGVLVDALPPFDGATIDAVIKCHIDQVEKFVSGTPLLIRYNSRLPVVIYAPKGFEIRYRIWQTPETTQKAEKG
mgnify:CR=1 FL=1